MAAKKVGVLVKEARTEAGLTQEKLAKTAGEGLSAADISKCERGEADLTVAQLKKIAAACGVTQKSLVEAPKNLKTTTAKTSSAKTTAAKTSGTAKKETETTVAKKASSKASGTAKKETEITAKKTTSPKTSAAKTDAKTTAVKTASLKTGAAKKTEKKATTPAGANTSMKVTATEKKLIEVYREAPADLKKAALKLLKGEYGDTINNLLSASSGAGSDAVDGIGEMLGGLIGNLLGGNK